MSLMDTLAPQTVNVTGARKVLQMTKRDDAEDLKLNQATKDEMDLRKYLIKKSREEVKAQKKASDVERRRIARLRDNVRWTKSKYDLAVKELEEALNENLP